MARNRIMSLLYLCALLSIPSLVMAQTFATRVPTEPVWENVPARAGVSKVKPQAKRIMKVKPPEYFRPISRYLPFTFGTGGFLPTPQRGQPQISARVIFAQIKGTAHRALPTFPVYYEEPVEFQRDLGLSGYFPVFSITAQYQLLPAWGFRYTFTPMDISATPQLERGFTYLGQTFTAGSRVNTRWERHDHRAGLVFNVVRKPSSLVSVYGEWLHSQVTLSIRDRTTAAILGTARYDNDKDLAVLGLELERYLTNIGDSSLGLKCKAGAAFLDNHFGYEAEAALSYALRINSRSYGFLRGGYRYAKLEKEKNNIKSGVTVDGGFLEVALLF